MDTHLPGFEAETLRRLAQQFGTPLYAYSEEVIAERYAVLSKAVSAAKSLLCYAVKANSNLSIISKFVQLGAGFDIVSEGELRRVIVSGGDLRKVVFSGVGKTRDEIEFALRNHIKLINVESYAELELIDQVAVQLSLKAPIALRVNPDIDVKTHPYLATGLQSSKFGVPSSEIAALAERVRRSKHLSLCGVDCHIGSQVSDVSAWREAYQHVLRLALALRALGFDIKHVDLGGGFPISYGGKYSDLDLAAYTEVFAELSKGLEFEFIFEPGRFLIAEAGVLLTRVLLCKENSGKHFVVVDAGMNDLIRPSLYEAYHPIDVLSRELRPAVSTRVVDVVGPVCETGCFFAQGRELPEVFRGDLLVIRDSGAYGFSMASRYNTRRLPAEVLIDLCGEARLIRAREDFEDAWEHELEYLR